MKEAREIIRMSLGEGEAARLALSSGGASAARRYVLYCAWHKIKKDRAIPENKRVAVFTELCEKTEVILES